MPARSSARRPARAAAAKAVAAKPAAAQGHAAHTKSADNALGLPGAMPRPIKVTMLGAGSGFTPRLANDVMRIPGNQGGTIALVDIDPDRLTTMVKLIKRLIDQLGLAACWEVVGSTERAKVLAGSDYLVNCIEVSGLACVAFDNDIPLKYGIDQCIGDTIGPGGLFKALRTIPVWLEVLRDAADLCPQALVLNYTNPMNMLCLAAGRTSPLPVVGLCHSVQGTSHLLARRAGIPYEQMTWECAGINHLAWFTRLQHQGRDLYPDLMAQAQAEIYGNLADSKNADPQDVGHDLVRKDMMLHFGAFITESSGHLSEYLPYYRKRVDCKARYCRQNYEGGSRFYASNWPNWRKDADEKRMRMVSGQEAVGWPRSWEYASWIIEAREKDTPYRIHGNVMNWSPTPAPAPGNGPGAARAACLAPPASGQLIANLPADGCVEVACMIDRNGINPTRYGKLPPQMAAICASNMAMFDLGAQAAIEKSKELAIHSLLLDPLSAACCTPAEIKAMALELFEAEKDHLPGYK